MVMRLGAVLGVTQPGLRCTARHMVYLLVLREGTI